MGPEENAARIYRQAVALTGGESSRPVRALLLEYLTMVVPRPSDLHSQYLRLAVTVARTYPDFNFVRFFDMWGPQFLRPEDFTSPAGDNSLASEALELVIMSPEVSELPHLLSLLNCPVARRMSLMRECFDSIVTKMVEEKDYARAVDLLEQYAVHPALHGADVAHTHLLSLALKAMDGNERSRFVPFFSRWSLATMEPDDFVPAVGHDGLSHRPLVARAIERCFEILKENPERYHAFMPSLLDNIESIPPGTDSETLRVTRRSMLLEWMNRGDEAKSCMARHAAGRTRDAAFWLEYAAMAPTPAKALSILALGFLSCRDNLEDSRRADLMLTLAQQLHVNGYEDAAATVIYGYDRDTHAGMVAEPVARYEAVKMTIDPHAVANYDNEMLYHRLAAEALDDIYYNVPGENMCVTRRDGDLITLSSSTALPVVVDVVLWPAANQLHIGDIVKVKRRDSEILMIRTLVDNIPFSTLQECVGIATDHNALQTALHPNPYPCDRPLSIGEFYHGYKVKKFDGTVYVANLSRLEAKEAWKHFDRATAAVYTSDKDSAGLVTEEWDAVVPASLLQECVTEVAASLPGEVRVGGLYKVYYYTDSHRRHVILRAEELPDDFSAPGLISEVSGALEKPEDGSAVAVVRGAVVSVELLDSSSIDYGTYVRCRALCHPDGTLHAISISTYN